MRAVRALFCSWSVSPCAYKELSGQELIADGETCVPPRRPALGLQHRRQLQCQWPICLGVADEDICHRGTVAQGYSITSSARTLASEMRSLRLLLARRRRYTFPHRRSGGLALSAFAVDARYVKPTLYDAKVEGLPSR